MVPNSTSGGGEEASPPPSLCPSLRPALRALWSGVQHLLPLAFSKNCI